MRRALINDDPPGRSEAQAVALRELEARGANGSGRKWWAFEGSTSADCWVETERLVLVIEGKRNEPLSASTAWYPKRNQLVRNLEVAVEAAGPDRRAAVVLAVEHELEDPLSEATLAGGAPHLDEDGRQRLRDAFVGQLTWQEILEAFRLEPAEVLPDTIDDPRADVRYAQRREQRPGTS